MIVYCCIPYNLHFRSNLQMSHNTFFLPTDLPAPEVGSVEDSTVTAGDSHTLQCTVTEIPHLAVHHCGANRARK